jgi:hypothetical protein
MRKGKYLLSTGVPVVVVLGLLSGCGQPLRTLMGLGNEQKAQQAYVARESSRFEVLLRDARNNRVKEGLSFSAVVSRYGSPVAIKDGSFLYRDPVDFFNSAKVYMTFDANERLTRVRIETRDGK